MGSLPSTLIRVTSQKCSSLEFIRERLKSPRTTLFRCGESGPESFQGFRTRGKGVANRRQGVQPLVPCAHIAAKAYFRTILLLIREELVELCTGVSFHCEAT